MSEVLRAIKGDREIEDCPVSPSALTEMIKMIKDSIISGKIGKRCI